MSRTKTNRRQDQMYATLITLVKLAETLASDRPNTNERRRQQSHCWAPFTDETSNRLGLYHKYYVFYRLLSTTHWFINNWEQTPLNRVQHLPAQYKWLIDGIKQNWLRDNDWTTDNLTNNKRLSNCENTRIEKHQWHYESSLPITWRLNWPIRLITRVYYHQLTWYNSLWLWRWLPHRLSKHCEPQSFIFEVVTQGKM